MIGPILIVDDDTDVLHAARLLLKPEAGRIDAAVTLVDVEDRLSPGDYDVVLLDMNFGLGRRGGDEGIDGLGRILAADPAVSVVLMTAFGGVALAVEALKRGAADFILKPWRNEILLSTVVAAAHAARTRRRTDAVFDLEALERNAVERALAHFDGNISHTAAALGLTRAALYRRLAKHGLPKDGLG
jgi:DNA-binding NtrC family response regulator